MEKRKNLAVLVLSALLLFGFCAAGLLLPDRDVSPSERRRLEKPPAFHAASLLSGAYAKELDAYLLDQFPLREGLRRLRAAIGYYGLRQGDVNGFFLSDGGIFKIEYPLRAAQVRYAAERINDICARYLEGMNVYYAVIPDKSCFAPAAGGHPAIDYAEVLALMQETVQTARRIDIFDCLSAEDYYRTDIHWRQERIFPVARRLAEGMGADGALTPYAAYTQNSLFPFYGVYYGQSALPAAPDTLVYLTCAVTEGASASSAEREGPLPVYDPALFSGMDGYDVFLSGAQAVVTMECDGPPGRELLLFRDSFGSSIAPLLLGAYAKITLIDLRYVTGDALAQFLSFGTQDVLFLYGTPLLNSGLLLR